MIKLNIDIKYNGLKTFRFKKEFKQILRNLQTYFKLENKEISVDVLITNNEEIKKLNKKFRNKDYATDILSFDFSGKDIYKNLPIFPLGELIISHEKVKQQAKEFNHSIKREYCYLFTHGLVHLMGFDHELEEERIQMNKIVDDIFKPLNINRKREEKENGN
ncbi:metal-dependent hydrolase [Mycoplasmopsis maculosa]|uniref:Endoribonuclease YbeY n=1 Tax=Mycoplasmopsis maculosa TaxID=114885 RepID=A0A449B551_9BACT|nr:rRNA maturation RNase YbeY [Mycoplasmopsis maculosa]VEU75696.1 metal-dependent hydrolase [Mycoplasmopsis maculosa]